MTIHPYCKFKTDTIKERTNYLTVIAAEILFDMSEYCQATGLTLEVTDSVSTPEEDKALNRVSDEHSTGRAFDLSVRGWFPKAVDDFVQHFEKKYLFAAALSKVTGEPRLILRHDSGHGDHIHIQVGRVYALKNPFVKLAQT